MSTVEATFVPTFTTSLSPGSNTTLSPGLESTYGSNSSIQTLIDDVVEYVFGGNYTLNSTNGTNNTNGFIHEVVDTVEKQASEVAHRIAEAVDNYTFSPTPQLTTSSPTLAPTEAEDDDFDPSETSIYHLLLDHPLLGSIMLISTIVCGCIVFNKSYHHTQSLLKCPPSNLRRYYIVISNFPSVQSAYCILAVMFPLVSIWFQVVVEVWDSLCMLYFCWMLIELMGGQKKLVAELDSAGEKAYWSVPPCGCLITCCIRPGTFSATTLTTIQALVAQYIVIQPIIVFVEAMDISTNKERDSIVLLAAQVVRVLSTLMCMQGLLVLYFALRDHLHEYNTTGKFIIIKGMLALTQLQETLLFIFISTDVISSDNYSKTAWAGLWNCLIMSIELVPLFMYTAYVYPASELPDAANEQSPLL